MATDEDVTVRIRGRAKIELEREVVVEVARRVELLDATFFGRCRDDKLSTDIALLAIVGSRMAIKINCCIHDMVDGHFLVASLSFLYVGQLSVGWFLETPTVESASVEKR